MAFGFTKPEALAALARLALGGYRGDNEQGRAWISSARTTGER
jgi:hypothetical protein